MSIDFALGWIRSRVVADKATDPVADTVGSGGRTVALSALAEVVVLVGMPVNCRVLAKTLDMAPQELQPCLELLETAGIIGLMNGVFRIVDPSKRCAITPATKVELHRRAAEALAEQPASTNHAQASAIAMHFQSAQCWLPAFEWWREATERALATGELARASDHLERALSICGSHPGLVPLESELAALNLMGPIRAQIKGSGADEVASIYARCAELAAHRGIAETTDAFNVLWGLAACIMVHGRLDTARELSAKLMRIAKRSGEAASLVLAARLCGLAAFLSGDLDAAIDNFATVQRVYDRKLYAGMRFKFASDQGAVALAHKSWAETIAGRHQESDITGEAALELARRLRHPHTSAHVACVLAARAQILQDRGRTAPLAIAANALAKRHNFAYWLAWSELVLAWHEGSRDPHKGIGRAKAAIAAYGRTGATQALPYAHMLLADLALLAGDSQLILAAADTALAASEDCGVRIFEAETLRIKAMGVGPGLLRQRLLQSAIETARRQGALLFERRAAVPFFANCREKFSSGSELNEPVARLQLFFTYSK